MQSSCFKIGRFLAGAGALLVLPMMGWANLLSSVVGGTAGTGACSNTGTSSASCSATFSGMTVLGSYTGFLTAAANANYGSVSASTQVRATLPVGFNVKATASFLDTLTLLGGSGNGSIGYVFDGKITNISDFPNGFTFQQDALTPEGFQLLSNAVNFPFQYHTAFYQFSFGVPFTIQVSAKAQTVGLFEQFGDGSVSASLNGITVLDQNGNPLTGYTIESESGAAYPLPEPSSRLLLGTLTALLGWMMYRARNHRFKGNSTACDTAR